MRKKCLWCAKWKRAKYKIIVKLLLQLSKNAWGRAGREHGIRKIFLHTPHFDLKGIKELFTKVNPTPYSYRDWRGQTSCFNHSSMSCNRHPQSWGLTTSSSFLILVKTNLWWGGVGVLCLLGPSVSVVLILIHNDQSLSSGCYMEDREKLLWVRGFGFEVAQWQRIRQKCRRLRLDSSAGKIPLE